LGIASLTLNQPGKKESLNTALFGKIQLVRPMPFPPEREFPALVQRWRLDSTLQGQWLGKKQINNNRKNERNEKNNYVSICISRGYVARYFSSSWWRSR
jgi:hypothetical protein